MLNGFTSYFQIIFTLNLVYVASGRIKEIIDAFFYHNREEILSKLTLLKRDEQNQSIIATERQFLAQKLSNLEVEFINPAAKSMFFVVIVHTLILIIFSGIENVFKVKLTTEIIMRICSWYNVLFLILQVYFISCNFFSKLLIFKNRILLCIFSLYVLVSMFAFFQTNLYVIMYFDNITALKWHTIGFTLLPLLPFFYNIARVNYNYAQINKNIKHIEEMIKRNTEF